MSRPTGTCLPWELRLQAQGDPVHRSFLLTLRRGSDLMAKCVPCYRIQCTCELQACGIDEQIALAYNLFCFW